ncbi:hypothetical protein [Luteithermobacter gelatinilyticus]|uniref:hypothetical protein n=1 Tax=Luteithermobacter gelatinilyticus TaxID=2582913 RepID=UPI0011064EC5|nr:hypothetical protein [Luteithermobacter gelatinilyticus]
MTTSGEDTDPVVQAAMAIDQLAESYLDWTRTQVQDMWTLMAPFDGTAKVPDQLTLDKIYDLSHNIKGLGGSFNYPLMTDVGRLLCAYLRRVKTAETKAHPGLITAHIRALDLILRDNITGSGGDVGRRLVERLSVLAHQDLAKAEA